eukprot:3923323-Rhodomonas_salina.1
MDGVVNSHAGSQLEEHTLIHAQNPARRNEGNEEGRHDAEDGHGCQQRHQPVGCRHRQHRQSNGQRCRHSSHNPLDERVHDGDPFQPPSQADHSSVSVEVIGRFPPLIVLGLDDLEVLLHARHRQVGRNEGRAKHALLSVEVGVLVVPAEHHNICQRPETNASRREDKREKETRHRSHARQQHQSPPHSCSIPIASRYNPHHRATPIAPAPTRAMEPGTRGSWLCGIAGSRT